MTADTFPRTWRGRIIESAKLIGALSIIFGFFGGAWSVSYGPAADILQQWRDMQIAITELRQDVQALQGEDRVIRQPPGLSYIEEPVTQGENVYMILVVSRTRLGNDCRLLEWVPLFSDEMNIPTPGERANSGPVVRQINDTETRMRVEMVPPETLRPGRITVYLALTYQCPGAANGGIVNDRTAVLAYELLPLE
jgi:hypothetical protein